MTQKKSTPSHLRVLHPSEERQEPISAEKLIDLQNVAHRLQKLEDKIHQSLDQLESSFSSKRKNQRTRSLELHEAIDALKESLDKQISDLTKTLNQAQESSEPENSWWSRLKNFLSALSPFSYGSQQDYEKLLAEEFDPFGRDPQFELKIKPLFDFLYYKYWRITPVGLENIPSQGRALLVSNHSGTLAYDGSMIRMAVSCDHTAQRDVRFLVEDFVYYLPFIGSAMYRLGGVRASAENAEKLLNQDHLVAVFPEGVKGIGKYYSQRYHLQRFGRGGFVRLAIKTRSPIIPVAVIGAEEIHPILYKSTLLAKPLGIPYVPFTPTLPWLGPLGLIPFPSKWTLYFGKPIHLEDYNPKILEDELAIHQLSEQVRSKIQEMVTEGLKQRRSIWWG